MIYVIDDCEPYSGRSIYFVEAAPADVPKLEAMIAAAEQRVIGTATKIAWRDRDPMTVEEWAMEACPGGVDLDSPESMERLRPFPPAIVEKRIAWDDEALAAYRKARRRWAREPTP